MIISLYYYNRIKVNVKMKSFPGAQSRAGEGPLAALGLRPSRGRGMDFFFGSSADPMQRAKRYSPFDIDAAKLYSHNGLLINRSAPFLQRGHGLHTVTLKQGHDG
jgi:hypothetical protein